MCQRPQTARAELRDVRAAIEVQELRVYDYEYPTVSSASLSTHLEVVGSQIKDAVPNCANEPPAYHVPAPLEGVRIRSGLMKRSIRAAVERKERVHNSSQPHSTSAAKLLSGRSVS